MHYTGFASLTFFRDWEKYSTLFTVKNLSFSIIFFAYPVGLNIGKNIGVIVM